MLPALTFARDLPFGRCVGVALPPRDDAAALESFGAGLAPEEQAFARTLSPARRVTWLGGRVALRAALADVAHQPGAAPLGPVGPILATPRGAPALPPEVMGSISHKASVAVALAARARAPEDVATLGVDVELDRPPRRDIASRVLIEAERRRVDALGSPAARAREVLVAFSAKEAIYKALDPWVGRHVSFQEVEVARAPEGSLLAALHLRTGESRFFVEVHEEPMADLILVAARLRRLALKFVT